MPLTLDDAELDALTELANIASAGAAGALSQLLDRDVDISVPRALVPPLADAVDACGHPEQEIAAIAIAVEGDLEAHVLLLIPPAHGAHLCALLGIEPGSEIGESALREIGNILGASYLGGLGAMTGLELLPSPPVLRRDMLGAVIGSLAARMLSRDEVTLLLDSELTIAHEQCAISFLMLPTSGGIAGLLAPLGLGRGGTRTR